MPITIQSRYGMTWEEVRLGSPLHGVTGLPFGYLTGNAPHYPFMGVVVFAGIDVIQEPLEAGDFGVSISSTLGNGGGVGVATFTNQGDDQGKITYQVGGTGPEFDAFGGGFSIACSAGDLATYFIIIQLGNAVEEPYIFGGSPPPPRKVSTPIVTPPEPDDDWGFVTISWTTEDILDTEVMGFQVWTHANYPGAVAYLVGNVAAVGSTHPNYSFLYAIGANEWPDSEFEYTFTVIPVLWTDSLADPPEGTLGEESDESEPVIYFPDGTPPIPPEDEVPDIELPPLDPETELPIPGVPVDPDVDPDSPTESEEIDPDTGKPYPAGTLKGAGYGGFALGGSSLEDAVFIMNPSGIYTLVEDKTHDTLYERMTGITTQNVKIPDPFVKTGFVGE